VAVESAGRVCPLGEPQLGRRRGGIAIFKLGVELAIAAAQRNHTASNDEREARLSVRERELTKSIGVGGNEDGIESIGTVVREFGKRPGEVDAPVPKLLIGNAVDIREVPDLMRGVPLVRGCLVVGGKLSKRSKGVDGMFAYRETRGSEVQTRALARRRKCNGLVNNLGPDVLLRAGVSGRERNDIAGDGREPLFRRGLPEVEGVVAAALGVANDDGLELSEVCGCQGGPFFVRNHDSCILVNSRRPKDIGYAEIVALDEIMPCKLTHLFS